MVDMDFFDYLSTLPIDLQATTIRPDAMHVP